MSDSIQIKRGKDAWVPVSIVLIRLLIARLSRLTSSGFPPLAGVDLDSSPGRLEFDPQLQLAL